MKREEKERKTGDRDPPCVDSKRHRVHVQYVSVCTGNRPGVENRCLMRMYCFGIYLIFTFVIIFAGMAERFPLDLRSLPGHWEPMILSKTSPTYNVLCNDDIQEFDSKWDGILLSMTRITHDDTLEGLYKLRLRESEKLKTVWELYDLEINQKKLGPDYYRLKTVVKRSEQENFEKNAVVKNQGIKQRVQRILGDCWQWETNGQCVNGDTCSFRHDINERGT